jgi:hypothetical protein
MSLVRIITGGGLFLVGYGLGYNYGLAGLVPAVVLGIVAGHIMRESDVSGR